VDSRRRLRSALPIVVALGAILVLLLGPMPEAPRPEGTEPVTAWRAVVVADADGLENDPYGGPSTPDGEPVPLPVDGDLLVRDVDGETPGALRWVWIASVETDAAAADYLPGDEVVITATRMPDGPAFVALSERWRLPVLLVLGTLFVALVLLVGRGHGLRALLALALTALVVVRIVLPLLLGGAPPVPVAVLVASGITVATILLTEGTGRVAVAAIAGTISALAVTGILAAAVGAFAAFAGAGTADLAYLRVASGDALDLRGLLLAAFILGALGVLDDVTVTQAATVEELARDGRLRGAHLAAAALRIGRSHIGATVNTLFLAYVGASLPLLVLFTVAELPAALVVNREIVAIEVVRTLVGSIGIVLAVPLTTAIAVLLVGRGDRGPANGPASD